MRKYFFRVISYVHTQFSVGMFCFVFDRAVSNMLQALKTKLQNEVTTKLFLVWRNSLLQITTRILFMNLS